MCMYKCPVENMPLKMILRHTEAQVMYMITTNAFIIRQAMIKTKILTIIHRHHMIHTMTSPLYFQLIRIRFIQKLSDKTASDKVTL